MLELAEDEQEVFTQKMVKRALAGVTPSKKLTFYALVGAPGSGKSTMARKIKNAVLISTDYVLAEYAKDLGIDTRGGFSDNEVGLFATKVSNVIYKTALRNHMDIVYDTAALHNTKAMLEHVQQFGYEPQIKIMLADEYQAAMNAVERKLDFDDAYTYGHSAAYFDEYNRQAYPDGNPLAVQPQVSLNVSMAVEDFVQEALDQNIPVEIYEFGKDKPSFRTGDDFDKFIDDLQLTPMEEHIDRCEKLYRRADKQGNEQYMMSLLALKRKMERS